TPAVGEASACAEAVCACDAAEANRETEMSVATSTFIAALSMPLLFARNSQVILIVSGLLVELVPLVLNVGFVHLLYPILRFDFFHCYRHRLFSVMQNIHDVFSDCFS